MNDLRRRLPVLLLASLLLVPSTARAGEDTRPDGPPVAPVTAAPEHPGLPWAAAEAHGGRLEVTDSGLAVLHLAGTPEQMGRQHGTLLRDAVRHLTSTYLPTILRGDREAALVRARRLERRIPERFRLEMQALAKAAGVPYDDILLGSVVVELFGLNLCSGAVAFGPATEDGTCIVGRNLEWPDRGILGRYGLVVVARPEGRKPFVSVGFPAMVGVVTGMNGDGVFTGELVVMEGVDREQALDGTPYPILQRRLMEECGSLAEAVALVKEAPRTVAQNLLLADPAGGIVLECAVDRLVERKPVGGLVVVTNHFDEPETPPEQKTGFDIRYTGLCLAFAKVSDGKINAESMRTAIKGAVDLPMVGTLNLQHGVFFPGTLRARIAVGAPPAYKGTLHELDLAPWLGVTAPADRKVATPEDAGGR